MTRDTYILDLWAAQAAPARSERASCSPAPAEKTGLLESLRLHWPEYLMEAAGLGFFMIVACSFGTLLENPVSPVRQAISNAFLRRMLMGMAMGLTAISIIYSPWGKQSGAHINPSTTLTFFRLGKVKGPDAFFYVLSQFAGGVLGTWIAIALLGNWVADPAVNYVATVPGMWGRGVAFLAEIFITFVLMTVVLQATNADKLARYTGLFVGMLVCSYITFEAPVSGMSMNPARTFASAVPGRMWQTLWLYFTAPPIGMLLAAELYVRRRGLNGVICAKFHHHNDKRCIFRCGYAMRAAAGATNQS